MKAKLLMLVACLCLVFSAASSKAQTCPDFRVTNWNVNNCPWNYVLVWNCGGSFTYVNGTVGVGSFNTEPNPGTPPNCCTFAKIGIYDFNNNLITLTAANNSATILDCSNNPVLVKLIITGSTVAGVDLY